MNGSLSKSARQAFTLVELLVVIAISGILMAMILPAVQNAREAARRKQCANNVRQIAVSILNYESQRKTFPSGGMAAASGSYGYSWWVRIFPYLEENSIALNFDTKGNNSGWVGSNTSNFNLLNGVNFGFMRCPTSPMPQSSDLGTGTFCIPNYAGNSGAKDHVTAYQVNDSGTKGYISAGGILVLRREIRAAKVHDGLSKTMMVMEQSDYCIDETTGASRNCAAHCGHGFMMGATNDNSRQFQVTSTLHPVNSKSWSLLGVNGESGQCHASTPIQSTHTGGATVCAADGSTHYLNETIDIQTLYNLANRDDGNTSAGSPFE